MTTKIETLENLLECNKRYILQYKNSLLMNLIADDILAKNEHRKILLAAIQTFSNYFQKTVLLRSILTEDHHFLKIANEHLKEEFLHNEKLNADRSFAAPHFDPILEATSSWFAWKMFTLNDEERLLLVHMVLEASAAIFFHKADFVMKKFNETDYFSIHNELDQAHEKLGIELLKDLPARMYHRLAVVQQQGWQMLITTCDRIAIIVSPEIGNSKKILKMVLSDA